jgi:hypothetical protein
VEIKPSIGDDYPGILRQMKGQGQSARFRGIEGVCVLLYGKFEARGATLDQVKKIFAEAGIRMVCLNEVHPRQLALFLRGGHLPPSAMLSRCSRTSQRVHQLVMSQFEQES